MLASQVDSKGTFIEQRVLSDVKRRAFKKADRQILLGQIVAQTVNPETVSQEEIEDGTAMLSQQYSKNLAQSMLNTKAVMQQGLMNSLYQGGGAGNPAQYAAQQQAMLNQYQNASNQP